MAGRYDITIEQGATFSLPLVIKNSDGSYFNLTNYTPRGQIRKYIRSTTIIVSFNFTITDAINGAMIVSLTAIQTAAILAGETSTEAKSKYIYDIEIVHSSGEPVKRILNGSVYVNPNVTR